MSLALFFCAVLVALTTSVVVFVCVYHVIGFLIALVQVLFIRR